VHAQARDSASTGLQRRPPEADASGARPTNRLNVAMVSTHEPRECGIATFTSDLASALADVDHSIRVSWAAIEDDLPDSAPRPEVRWRIRQGDQSSYERAAADLNASDIDIVSVQHEFGLYGIWGEQFDDHLASFLERLCKPLITTFHTVLPTPSPTVFDAVRRLGSRSDAVVIMTERAGEILEETYGLDPRVLNVVPHGAPPVTHADREAMKSRLGLGGRSVISTFGFVDPRKGLEYMIEGMSEVARFHPAAIYLVLGKTHPDLTRNKEDAYRTSLRDLVEARGLRDHVVFVDRYLSKAEILDYLIASDVYVTPYLDPSQITSGTLSYALGAGKAIVSTEYAHAAEALGDRRGLLVGFRSASELANAVRSVLENPDLKAELERNADAVGAHLTWPNVATQVSRLYRGLALP